MGELQPKDIGENQDALIDEEQSSPSIGYLIKSRREELGLSKRNVAEGIFRRSNVYIDTNYINQLEQGGINLPKPRNFVQIARELGLSEASLLRAAGYLSGPEASPGNPFVEQDPRHEIVEMLSQVDEGGAIYLRRVTQRYIEQTTEQPAQPQDLE